MSSRSKHSSLSCFTMRTNVLPTLQSASESLNKKINPAQERTNLNVKTEKKTRNKPASVKKVESLAFWLRRKLEGKSLFVSFNHDEHVRQSNLLSYEPEYFRLGRLKLSSLIIIMSIY